MPFTSASAYTGMGVFFVAGFTVGFGHCIGMCGPIAVSLSLKLRDHPALAPHLFYNLGRVSTYAMLGALMGLTGSFTGIAARMAGLQKGVMILAGIMIMIMGMAMAGGFRRGAMFCDHAPPPGFITRSFQRLSRTPGRFGYLLMGLILGLLPCGPVYTALIAAARTGMETRSTWTGVCAGAGLMISFGLGTAPAMLLVGRLAGMKWLTRRERIYRLGAALMILTGAIFIYRAAGW